MNNNYFNINKYSYNTVMHCKSVKEIKILLDYLEAAGHPWCLLYNKEDAYAIAEKIYSDYIMLVLGSFLLITVILPMRNHNVFMKRDHRLFREN